MPMFYHLLFFSNVLASGFFWWSCRALTPKGKLYPFRTSPRTQSASYILLIAASSLAYFLPVFVVTLIPILLLATAYNATQIPLVRSIGEERILQLASESASKENFWHGLFIRLIPPILYALFALFIYMFFSRSDSWGFWIALGVGSYSLVQLIVQGTGYFRFRKIGQNGKPS
jgi:hypothetical protein